MLDKEPKKELNFYYKIFLAVLAITILNIVYLVYRDMSGNISFYYGSIRKKAILIILSLFVMPVLYVLIFASSFLLKKTNRNVCICAGVLSFLCLFFIHTNTVYANYEYKQEKSITDMNLEYFKWEENNNAPLGYPIEVYRGGLELKGGGYVGLSHHGTSSGRNGWGSYGSGMSGEAKALPERLNITWLSYAENSFYTINCTIDYNKILKLFREGFYEKDASGKIRHETYRTIIVGYAPGGVVVVWVHASTKQVEIGRYQGQKTEISEEEIRSLDYPDKVLFDQVYRDKKMKNPGIIPTTIQEANKNKPIPYGIWDTYREKYIWRPTFIQNKFGNHTFTMKYARLEMYNGEIEVLFDEPLIKNEYTSRAILKRINFAWIDQDNQVYSGTVEFNETTIFDAFKDYKEAPIELEFMVNISNDFVVVRLKSEGKEIFINKDAKVEVFKSKKYR